MTYSEKLRDPRWQKKRLEIMERDEFTCQICGDEKSPLNVHHMIYFKNHDPWDYDNSYLVTLCEDCHNDEKEMNDCAGEGLIRALKSKRFFSADICDLGVAFHENEMPHIPEVVTTFFYYLFSNREFSKKCFDLYFKFLKEENAKIKKSNG